MADGHAFIINLNERGMLTRDFTIRTTGLGNGGKA